MKRLLPAIFLMFVSVHCFSQAEFNVIKTVTVGDNITEIRRSTEKLTLVGLIQETDNASEKVYTITSDSEEYTIIYKRNIAIQRQLVSTIGATVSISGFIEIHTHNIANGKYLVVEKFIYPDAATDIMR